MAQNLHEDSQIIEISHDQIKFSLEDKAIPFGIKTDQLRSQIFNIIQNQYQFWTLIKNKSNNYNYLSRLGFKIISEIESFQKANGMEDLTFHNSDISILFKKASKYLGYELDNDTEDSTVHAIKKSNLRETAKSANEYTDTKYNVLKQIESKIPKRSDSLRLQERASNYLYFITKSDLPAEYHQKKYELYGVLLLPIIFFIVMVSFFTQVNYDSPYKNFANHVQVMLISNQILSQIGDLYLVSDAINEPNTLKTSKEEILHQLVSENLLFSQLDKEKGINYLSDHLLLNNQSLNGLIEIDNSQTNYLNLSTGHDFIFKNIETIVKEKSDTYSDFYQKSLYNLLNPYYLASEQAIKYSFMEMRDDFYRHHFNPYWVGRK